MLTIQRSLFKHLKARGITESTLRPLTKLGLFQSISAYTYYTSQVRMPYAKRPTPVRSAPVQFLLLSGWQFYCNLRIFLLSSHPSKTKNLEKFDAGYFIIREQQKQDWFIHGTTLSSALLFSAVAADSAFSTLPTSPAPAGICLLSLVASLTFSFGSTDSTAFAAFVVSVGAMTGSLGPSASFTLPALCLFEAVCGFGDPAEQREDKLTSFNKALRKRPSTLSWESKFTKSTCPEGSSSLCFVFLREIVSAELLLSAVEADLTPNEKANMSLLHGATKPLADVTKVETIQDTAHLSTNKDSQL
ncbi:hypothetical protein C0J52_25271 [Blattella germanica]|nr:hypothetical protein C0J52_25271 [Blattella germanica]